MPQITIPKGVNIEKRDDHKIRVKIPNTKFWISGERKAPNSWDVYLEDPETNRKDLMRENILTSTLSIYCAIVLRTPFPHLGKKNQDFTKVKRFAQKLTK